MKYQETGDAELVADPMRLNSRNGHSFWYLSGHYDRGWWRRWLAGNIKRI